jgi:hypothetical protein
MGAFSQFKDAGMQNLENELAQFRTAAAAKEAALNDQIQELSNLVVTLLQAAADRTAASDAQVQQLSLKVAQLEAELAAKGAAEGVCSPLAAALARAGQVKEAAAAAATSPATLDMTEQLQEAKAAAATNPDLTASHAVIQDLQRQRDELLAAVQAKVVAGYLSLVRKQEHELYEGQLKVARQLAIAAGEVCPRPEEEVSISSESDQQQPSHSELMAAALGALDQIQRARLAALQNKFGDLLQTLHDRDHQTDTWYTLAHGTFKGFARGDLEAVLLKHQTTYEENMEKVTRKSAKKLADIEDATERSLAKRASGAPAPPEACYCQERVTRHLMILSDVVQNRNSYLKQISNYVNVKDNQLKKARADREQLSAQVRELTEALEQAQGVQQQGEQPQALPQVQAAHQQQQGQVPQALPPQRQVQAPQQHILQRPPGLRPPGLGQPQQQPGQQQQGQRQQPRCGNQGGNGGGGA